MIPLFSFSLVLSHILLFLFYFSPNLDSNSYDYIGPTFFSSYSPCIPTLLYPFLSFLTLSYCTCSSPILSYFFHQTLYLLVSSSLGSLIKEMMSYHTEITVTSSTTSIESNNPYVYISSAPPSPAADKRSNSMDKIYGAINNYGKKVQEATKQAEIMVDNILNHLRVSSRPADAAITKLIQGTKVLASGGPDKLFQQTFGVFPGEKLLQPYACYLSTDSKPVIGTLYISTKRLAFCSDHPLCHHPFSLQQQQQHQCIYYKVMVNLDQLSKVCSPTNGLNPSEKRMQVITTDGYEFNFMGFMSYDKALKTVNEALKHKATTIPVFMK